MIWGTVWVLFVIAIIPTNVFERSKKKKTEHDDNVSLSWWYTDAAHLIDINNCENCLTIGERENTEKLLFC